VKKNKELEVGDIVIAATVPILSPLFPFYFMQKGLFYLCIYLFYAGWCVG
jgi:hypothetical protein